MHIKGNQLQQYSTDRVHNVLPVNIDRRGCVNHEHAERENQ